MSCSVKERQIKNELKEEFFCNAEEIDSVQMKLKEATGKNLLFANADRLTSKISFSGDNSLQLTPGNPYGFTTEIDNIKADEYIKVTAWRKSKNESGVIAIDGGEGFYVADKKIIENKNGWQKIVAEFLVPPNFISDKIKVYVWNTSQDTIYFDDIRITHKASKNYPEYDSIPGLHLYLDEIALQRFNQKRENAFRKTVLENSDEDYVQTILFDGSDFKDAEIRLKGDLVDHLQGQKWSFRIKLEQDFTWKHLRTFSIQNPSTRYFLYEWIAHEIFDQEDVLTTRYGFVPVKINDNSLGIYAWEEHFEKQLVESRNRREGTIIRFDETLFWKRVSETNITEREWDIDYFSAAQIIPFKEGKTTRDSMLKQQLVEAQKLLLQYKNFEQPVSELFNIEKLAKYYALIDITQAYHGFTWHNQRFYFNPVTCLLEPIAFDGYIENGIYKRIEEPVMALLNPDKIQQLHREELMLFQVFSDSLFNKKYMGYLEKYSSPAFIDNFISSYKPKTDSLSLLLEQEFSYYSFDFNYLETQAKFIRNNLTLIESNIVKLQHALSAISLNQFAHQYTEDVNPNFIPFLIHAYYDAKDKTLKILNYQNATIKVQGAFIKDQFPERFEPTIILQPYNGIKADTKTVEVKSKPSKILFSVNGSYYETTVKQWSFSEKFTSRQETIKQNEFNLPVSGDSIVLKGIYEFSSDVVIPASKKVIIEPGTKINLLNSAGFFSWSALNINGTAENPVVIFSGDNSAQGFNVLKTKRRSKIRNAKFEGLSSLHRGGWQSPAAVNFYEADVDFENCIFASNINCDDALNVVRSDFLVTGCRFENTFADAFDSDFCTGDVTNCIFENTGNDAIDFSGSDVSISDCKMIEISDKAISGGENSKLSVSNCEINKANIGVAAKDLSVVKLDKIVMNQTVYGLVAFRKKPEFGPADIIIDNLKLKNNMIFHQIEEGSKLTLNGKIIYGREKKLAKKLYQ